MLLISLLLIIEGAFAIYAGKVAYGDIGIACLIAGISSILSGIGFLIVRHRMK